MKDLKEKTWQYLKPSELMFVLFGVFIFLSAVAGVMIYRGEQFSGKLKYEDLSPDQKTKVKNLAENIQLGNDDQNVRYAERVREASSIALGVSIFLVSERISHNRVLTLEELMTEFSKSDLLPPSVQVVLPDRKTDYGMLRTDRGVYFIRYLPKPLKIEILSGSFAGKSDGVVFIIRLPDTTAANMSPQVDSQKVTSAGAWATLFEAPETGDHYIPPPFAPVETYKAMNWQIKPLQQTDISPERLQQLNDFLKREN